MEFSSLPYKLVRSQAELLIGVSKTRTRVWGQGLFIIVIVIIFLSLLSVSSLLF